MKKQSAYQEFIGRPEINFWLPIIISLISAAVSLMVYANKIDNRLNLVVQQQETIIAKLNEHLSDGKTENISNIQHFNQIDKNLATLNAIVKIDNK